MGSSGFEGWLKAGYQGTECSTECRAECQSTPEQVGLSRPECARCISCPTTCASEITVAAIKRRRRCRFTIVLADFTRR